MAFIVPAKITSKLPISRFNTIEESRDFLLQQRYTRECAHARASRFQTCILIALISIRLRTIPPPPPPRHTDLVAPHRKSVFQREGKSLYRITTKEEKNGYRYEVANGNDLSSIHHGQVRFIISHSTRHVTVSHSSLAFTALYHFTLHSGATSLPTCRH